MGNPLCDTCQREEAIDGQRFCSNECMLNWRRPGSSAPTRAEFPHINGLAQHIAPTREELIARVFVGLAIRDELATEDQLREAARYAITAADTLIDECQAPTPAVARCTYCGRPESDHKRPGFTHEFTPT